MKQFFLLIGFFIALSITLQAQDVLLKKNGDEIKCKVLEVTSSAINYSLPAINDSVKGELQSISKSEVFMIRYENGTKDVFNAPPPEPDYAKSAVIEEVVSDNIKNEGRKFYYHNRKIGKSRVIGLLRNEKNAEINKLVSKSIVCAVFAPILKFVSIPFGVVGIAVLAIGSDPANDVTSDGMALGAAGVAVLVLGQAGGYTVESFQYKNLKKAVTLYNTKHP